MNVLLELRSSYENKGETSNLDTDILYEIKWQIILDSKIIKSGRLTIVADKNELMKKWCNVLDDVLEKNTGIDSMQGCWTYDFQTRAEVIWTHNLSEERIFLEKVIESKYQELDALKSKSELLRRKSEALIAKILNKV